MNVPYIGFLMCLTGAAACTAKGDYLGTGILLIAAFACAWIDRSRANEAKGE